MSRSRIQIPALRARKRPPVAAGEDALIPSCAIAAGLAEAERARGSRRFREIVSAPLRRALSRLARGAR